MNPSTCEQPFPIFPLQTLEVLVLEKVVVVANWLSKWSKTNSDFKKVTALEPHHSGGLWYFTGHI